MNTYQLKLKRGSIVLSETFTGSKLDLMMYKFKMRKWEIIIL